MITWDWVVGFIIIAWILLVIIARIAGLTISELFSQIKDFLGGVREDAQDSSEQFVQFYE